MIDHRFQGRGYGRKALGQVVAYVRARSAQSHLRSSYVPGPHSPAGFYLGFGFTETGEMDGNEVVISLAL